VIKAKLKANVKIQPGKLGMEGTPFHVAAGAFVNFPSEESYRRAVELYGDGVFEPLEEPKRRREKTEKAAEEPRGGEE
jgi:hypothetical protein